MKLLLRLFSPLVIALAFSGCTQKQQITHSTDPEKSTQAITSVKPIGESADEFIKLASQSTGVSRNQHLIRAAQILLSQQSIELASEQLSEINLELIDPLDNIEIKLLSAEIELQRGNARAALKQLNISSILPPNLQIRLMQLRARAFLDAGYPLESAKTRVQLDTILNDDFDQELNHQAIWESLSLLPKTSLQQISQAPLNPDFLGWIELAKIAKQGQVDWQSLQDGIYKWQARYPHHPAAKVFIKELGSKQVELIQRPKHIAVLLPLKGKYAQIAAAIRDGILSSYYQHPDINYRPEISFINTGNNQAAIWNYYKKAEDLGADFVIGPFLKSAVDSLTRSSQANIPTLTLNYARNQTRKINNLFQFGLLPEDEAMQSAEMAFRTGHSRAAILVPKGRWGQRLGNAFQQRFEDLGGQVMSREIFTANKNNFKKPIQSMLNIKQSYSRYRHIERVMGTKMKFIPYRRQDVDMIFIAATPRDSRQLKPQFRFHYAGEIPVFATSHSFTGQINKQADRDIDGLNFIDMPWILNPPNKFKQSLINYWPEQQRYTRFFALGVDAYNLIPFLARLKNKSYERFSGQTGNLFLDPSNRIHRELLWAKFYRGIPKLININNVPVILSKNENQPTQNSIQ